MNAEENNTTQNATRKEVPSQPHGYVLGDRVRIFHGPLAGLEGMVRKLKGRTRLLVSVTLLQRPVEVDIESCWVEAASKKPIRRSSPELTDIVGLAG